jgi:hypothetical protein
MMLMIPHREQGFPGKGAGSLGQLVERLLQVGGLLPFLLFLVPLAIPLFPVDVPQGTDEQGILAPSHVL